MSQANGGSDRPSVARRHRRSRCPAAFPFFHGKRPDFSLHPSEFVYYLRNLVPVDNSGDHVTLPIRTVLIPLFIDLLMWIPFELIEPQSKIPFGALLGLEKALFCSSELRALRSAIRL